ncbi:hypothetical protein [Falsirhodobacter sp. 20TX0035]|uniref:hypothetical protein n=1 Tax=Falsirhodobacter sp. 20TX0035 TaxID=3022019 RepID=UPI0023306CAB|nr:hypothetical protein [Falsirhodobacter sp. 20TX0035]MDB6452592.1 hypothetical protein [Falsirhodobacter sp. 20TX0035]
MFKNSGSIAALLVVAALAACSDSDGGSSRDESPSFAELATRNEEMADRVAAMAETTTLPTAGSATYEGTGAFNVGADASTDMLAELTLEANFETSEVGGEFSNFVGADGREIGGELTVQDSVANLNAFDAQVAGTLDDNGAKEVDALMSGAFRGADAEAVSGTIEGTIGSDTLGGDFVAEKK